MATEQKYLENENWIKKMKQQFDGFDKNKNGFLSQDDWIAWVNNLKTVLKVSDEKVKEIRELHLRYASLLGAVRPGVQVTQDEFIKAAAKFAANEKESKALLAEMNRAMFDVLDTNKDGTVSLTEYSKLLESQGMDPGVAKTVFDSVDANHNGKIEVKELFALSEKFWFTCDPIAE